MQVILANAKIMHSNTKREPLTQPMFQTIANELAMDMSTLSIEELALQLDCSQAIAAENWQRYQMFHSARKMPAILSYNGQAYKHLKAQTLNNESMNFAQEHVWITCFLYGLLRPLDGIVPYRMEHCVKLPHTDNKPVNRFWKSRLTDVLIDRVKADDGILLHLSTEEYEHLFDWKRVRSEISVIQPLFYVRKNGQLKMQAVWAKSCRGAMLRFFLNHQIQTPEELTAFNYEGFEFQPHLGEAAFPHFIRDI